MNDPHQIAADLDGRLVKFARRKIPVLSPRQRKKARISIIQSAIEKATEQLKRLREIDHRCALAQEEEIRRLRTAHASEPFHDTKRLDWLEKHEAMWRNVNGKSVRIVFKNFRQEIDAAMKEQPL